MEQKNTSYYEDKAAPIKVKDTIFEIMLSGVVSMEMIAMELNRMKCCGQNWQAVDIRKVLAD